MKILSRKDIVDLVENNMKGRDINVRNIVDQTVFSIIEILEKKLEMGDRLEIRGIGTFSLREVKSKPTHNPKTLEKIVSKGRTKVVFKAGKYLKNITK